MSKETRIENRSRYRRKIVSDVTDLGDGWFSTQVLVSVLGSLAAHLPNPKGGQPGGPMQADCISIEGNE